VKFVLAPKQNSLYLCIIKRNEMNLLQKHTAALEKKEFIPVVTEIVLGNPKMKCRKFGICNISPLLENSNILHLSPRKAAALLQYSQQKIIFRFLINSMTTQTRKRFFEDTLNGFVIETPIILPLFLSKELKIEQFIPRGNYTIFKTSVYYKVIFRLENL
jgi:hypothetical protein